jgi:hypothetical protein
MQLVLDELAAEFSLVHLGNFRMQSCFGKAFSGQYPAHHPNKTSTVLPECLVEAQALVHSASPCMALRVKILKLVVAVNLPGCLLRPSCASPESANPAFNPRRPVPREARIIHYTRLLIMQLNLILQLDHTTPSLVFTLRCLSSETTTTTEMDPLMGLGAAASIAQLCGSTRYDHRYVATRSQPMEGRRLYLDELGSTAYGTQGGLSKIEDWMRLSMASSHHQLEAD